MTFQGATYTATSQVLTLSRASKIIVTLTDAKTGAAQVTAGDPIATKIQAEASGTPVTTRDPVC